MVFTTSKELSIFSRQREYEKAVKDYQDALNFKKEYLKMVAEGGGRLEHRRKHARISLALAYWGLMGNFYRNLKTASKTEALRQAQLAMIRGVASSDLLAKRGVGGIAKLGEIPVPESPPQDSNFVPTSHPYFWAPFILVGDGK
jgi:hypothetical protein